MIMETIGDMILLLVPLALVQIALMVIALVDIAKRKRVAGNKTAWVLAIIIINILGPTAYLLFGRKEGDIEGD